MIGGQRSFMGHVRLGKTGMKVSLIALGCMSCGDPAATNAHTWALDDDDAQPFFRQGAEMGVTGEHLPARYV